MTYLGSILIVNNVDNHYILNKLNNQDIRFYGWLAICYMMITLPLGMLLSKLFFPIKDSKTFLLEYCKKKIQPIVGDNDESLRILLYIFSFLSFISLLYTLYYLKDIPFLSLLKGSSAIELSRQRASSSFAFGGIEYIRNLFGLILAPILSYVSFCYYHMTKSKNDFIWFISNLGIASILLLLDLQKAPFVLFIIGFMMIRVVMFNSLSIKRLIYFGLFSLIFIIIAYFFISEGFNSDVLFSYNHGIIGRLTLTSISGFYHSLEIFPEKIDFLGLRSLSEFTANLLNIDYSPRAARLIMIELFPENIYFGTGGVINSIFLLEAWANFGLFGILFSPIYVGFLIGLLYNFILTGPKSPLFLGLYAYFSYKPTIIGGFNDYIYNAGHIFIFLFVIFLLIFSKSIFLSSKKHFS